MEKTIRILIVEDNEDDCLLLLNELKAGGYDLVYERVFDAASMEKMLDERQWDLVCIDYVMPQFNALNALKILHERKLDIPAIIISGEIGEAVAVDAMKHGAHDYLMKDNLARLCLAVERELKEAIVRRERRESIEDLKVAKEKAEDAARAKGFFLANMSHEVRTPMNLILGYAQLLEKADLDDTQKEYLHIIRQTGSSLVSLFSDILDIAKLENGNFEIETSNVDLKETLDRIVKISELEVEKKGLKLKYNYDKNIPGIIKSDPHRIQKIILNLLDNAIKFTEQGEICIAARLDKARSAVKITIVDTGIGILASDQEMIFDSFSQVDMTTTKKYEGAGMGLFIAKKLADLMGGSIDLISEVGKGSEFTLTLPFETVEQLDGGDKQGAEISVAAVPSGDDIFKGLKVLEVDDDDGCSYLMCIYLKELGIKEIDTAFNGEEAVEKIKNNSYDIVLMDIKMPLMDGIEATKIIRKDISKDLPIIAVTAFVMPEDQEKYYESGMNGFCAKPVSGDTLKENILKFCSNK